MTLLCDYEQYSHMSYQNTIAVYDTRQVKHSAIKCDILMTLPAVCETLNRFIHFEHEQIGSKNHFYHTVSITTHSPQ